MPNIKKNISLSLKEVEKVLYKCYYKLGMSDHNLSNDSGLEIRKVVEETREKIGKYFNFEKEEISFQFQNEQFVIEILNQIIKHDYELVNNIILKKDNSTVSGFFYLNKFYKSNDPLFWKKIANKKVMFFINYTNLMKTKFLQKIKSINKQNLIFIDSSKVILNLNNFDFQLVDAFWWNLQKTFNFSGLTILGVRKEIKHFFQPLILGGIMNERYNSKNMVLKPFPYGFESGTSNLHLIFLTNLLLEKLNYAKKEKVDLKTFKKILWKN